MAWTLNYFFQPINFGIHFVQKSRYFRLDALRKKQRIPSVYYCILLRTHHHATRRKFHDSKKSDLIRISGAMRPSPKSSPHVWVNSFANKQACRTLAPSEANWPVGRTGRSTDAPPVFSGYFPMPFQRIENWK
jgi:hypothetical protein